MALKSETKKTNKDISKKKNEEKKENKKITSLKKDLKKLLSRSKKAKKGVNISKLEYFSKKFGSDVVFVVADKVLGSGKLSKPIKICAQSYSKTALEELKRSSSTILDFSNLKNILQTNKIKLVR